MGLHSYLLLLLLPCHLPGSDVLCDAKTVVHLPTPSTSHTKCHTNVARELVKLGHQVWVATPDYLLDHGGLDTSGLSVLQYDLSKNYEEGMMEPMRDTYFHDQRGDMNGMLSLTQEMCDEIVRNDSFIEAIRRLKPDLIVIDNVPFVRTLTVIAYKLGVPYAYLGTMYDARSKRIPFTPAVNPFYFLISSDRMSFFQRMVMFLFDAVMLVFDPFMPKNIVAIYAPEKPFIPNDLLFAGAEIWLVEMDHILDYPRPTLPNVKLIGGTATGPAKPLPPYFQSFMDSATQGVVVVSFGGSVVGLPPKLSDKLFQAFLQLPTKVVIRSNLTSPDPSKIMTSRWLPQNDLLAHPNTKAFVSHCGNSGQYEALYHAVPILCTPMWGDQPYNAERIRVKHFGEVLDLRSGSQEEFVGAISKLLQEPGYKAAITQASRLFRRLYGVPRQEAAMWLDHVMEFGGEYMRYQGQRIPWYQNMMLDVMAFVGTVCALVLLILVFCVRAMWRLCVKQKRKKE